MDTTLLSEAMLLTGATPRDAGALSYRSSTYGPIVRLTSLPSQSITSRHDGVKVYTQSHVHQGIWLLCCERAAMSSDTDGRFTLP